MKKEIKVWRSPLTNNIYAGYIGKDGTASEKFDVTNQVISAVMEHVGINYVLTLQRDDGAVFEITVRQRVPNKPEPEEKTE